MLAQLDAYPSPSTTHIVENDQWTVDAADSVVSYPWRHRDHAGVDYVRHGGGGEREVGEAGVLARSRPGLRLEAGWG